jgi:hypothetical protein
MNREDGPNESNRAQCVDCRAISPPTSTNYTLISAQYGWRLAPRVLADGRREMEWRCPACWARARKKK